MCTTYRGDLDAAASRRALATLNLGAVAMLPSLFA